MTRSAPRLAVVAWLLASGALVGLGFAVAHYWAQTTGGHEHAGMVMGAADALTRGGSGSPLNPLFGSALFTAWQLDALAVAVLLLVAAAYLTGIALVPVRTPGERWPVRHTAAFLAGLAVCGFATNGSIAVYDQVLFTAHMTGHLALVMLAPALLVAGRPLTLLLAASSPATRARCERVLRGRAVALLTAPPVALATYTAVIVGSHLTGLMDTIMRNTWAGQLEHVVYVLAGCQFFVLVIGAEPIRWRLGSPARWLLLAIAMAVDTFTGIALMQGTSPVHVRPSELNVNALSDTHTGGAIMWVGGDGIMLVIMVALVVAWLRDADARPAEHGWLEQARSTTFQSRTGASEAAGAALDDDDEARTAYNRWLKELDARGH